MDSIAHNYFTNLWPPQAENHRGSVQAGRTPLPYGAHFRPLTDEDERLIDTFIEQVAEGQMPHAGSAERKAYEQYRVNERFMSS